MKTETEIKRHIETLKIKQQKLTLLNGEYLRYQGGIEELEWVIK
jgi:hypothetical protein